MSGSYAGADYGQPILVFRIGSLGDTLVAIPALRAIRQRHADSIITLLTNTPADGGLRAASATQVLAGAGLVDDYIEYPHGSLSLTKIWKVVRRIRSKGPRVCYFLMPNRSNSQARRDRLFLRLAGIRQISGLDPDRFAARGPKQGSSLWESEAVRLMRTIGQEQPELTPRDFSLDLKADELTLAASDLQLRGIVGPYIVVSIGAKSPVNDWGETRWHKCIQFIGERAGTLGLVAIGSAVEAERSDRLLRNWPGRRTNFCGRLSPRESAAVLAGASLFLGHDSGPMHLAAAVETPTIGVFSARNLPGKWFPIGQEANVFYNSVPCRGCGLEVCIENRQRCVTEIDPRHVAERALRIVSRSNLNEADFGSPLPFSGLVA